MTDGEDRIDHVLDPNTGGIAYFDRQNSEAWIKAENPEVVEE